LRIRYEGKQAKPRCRVFADDVQVSFGMELEENEVEKVLAPVGTVEVRLRTAEGQPLETRAVEVRAGETQDVVFADPR
jgi:hypothetical protein